MKRFLGTAVLLLSLNSFADEAPDGAAIYRGKCKSCHGADGRADTKIGRQGKIEDFSTAKWQAEFTDAKILEVLRDGVKNTKMKSYKDRLTQAELDAVSKHLRTFAK
jgi:mono/diheme cytochrome c family protein